MRCAQCRSLWFERAPEDFAPGVEPEIAVEAQSARLDEWPAAKLAANENLPIVKSPRRRHLFRRLRGVLFAAGAAAALMAAVAQREAIVRLLPGMQGLYAAIGLPVNLRGLDLRTVKSAMVEDGSQHIIAVTGEIANLRSVAQTVPSVRIALRGADGREVYNWTAPPPKPRLAAGETIAFRTRLADPPSGARDVVVRFAEVSGPDLAAGNGR